MQRLLLDRVSLLLIAGLIVILDQASKHWVRANLALGEVYRPELWISQFTRFIHLHNRGAAIDASPGMGIFSMGVAILAAAVIFYAYPRISSQDRMMRLSIALLLGGVLGNLVDRLHQGYVTDFISLLDVPVVNLADLSIITGTILLSVGLVQKERRLKRRPSSDSEAENSPRYPGGGRRLSIQASSKDSRGE